METQTRWSWPLIAGVLLVIAGTLFLLNNLGWIASPAPFLWAALFLTAALLFLIPFLRDQQQWWALIPAGVLASLALTILINHLFPEADELAGAAFLGGLAVTFLAIFLFHPNHWWATIPGGTLTLLSGVVFIGAIPLLPERWVDPLRGSLFLGGLAIAFVIVYIFRQDQWWALIPGGILLVLASTPIIAQISWMEQWIPLVLFGGWACVFLILYALTQMRWSLWVGAGLAALAALIQIATGPAWLGSSIVALVLILLGGYLLLRARHPS